MSRIALKQKWHTFLYAYKLREMAVSKRMMTREKIKTNSVQIWKPFVSLFDAFRSRWYDSIELTKSRNLSVYSMLSLWFAWFVIVFIIHVNVYIHNTVPMMTILHAMLLLDRRWHGQLVIPCVVCICFWFFRAHTLNNLLAVLIVV